MPRRSGNVSLTCRYYGISRQCFYTWRRRYDAHGLDGPRDRSHRPQVSPNATRTESWARSSTASALLLRAGQDRDTSSATTRCRSAAQGCGGSCRIDAEEFYRMLEGVVIDDAEVFNDKLQEWEDFYNYHRPTAASAARPPMKD
jgi:transposase-like protein